MEKDAVERKGLKQLLLEPEALQSLEKDVGLVATILAFKHLMPEQTRQTARQVVAEIVEDLRRRLEDQTRQALLGAMRRDRRSPLKVARNLDLRRTVREGLRQYQPELKKEQCIDPSTARSRSPRASSGSVRAPLRMTKSWENRHHPRSRCLPDCYL